MTIENQAIRNAYRMFKEIYDNERLKENSEHKHTQLPLILAVFAIQLSDVVLIDEVISNYGINSFATPLSNWSVGLIESFGINFTGSSTRTSSPTGISQIFD